MDKCGIYGFRTGIWAIKHFAEIGTWKRVKGSSVDTGRKCPHTSPWLGQLVSYFLPLSHSAAIQECKSRYYLMLSIN